MSAKGYSAVPTDEARDSADIESHVPSADDQTNLDRNDDVEDEPSPSDRLLPFGAYDGGAPNQREPFRKRATRWLQSRPSRIAASYRAFRKRYSARSIVLVAIIGFLLASTTGLAISTGILAARPSRCYSCYNSIETRIPWNWRQGSDWTNRGLDLHTLLPPLSQDAEPSCKYAWAMLERIDCHEKVLNRAWDDGKQRSIFEPRYDLYAPILSQSNCLKDLELTHQLLSSQCTVKDTFDTSEYVGPMTADPYLESGPVAAVKTLVDRVRHTARRPPTEPHYRSWASAPCVAELYQDWFIVDGKNSANLNGLDAFLKATNSRSPKSDPEYIYRNFADDRCDGAYAPSRPYSDRSEKRGPSDGDTRCSWCLINWFDRKLQSWEEGKISDPVNGTEVSLPHYLRTIEHAGRRCQSNDWERIYRKNVWMYQEKGWLPDDWEGEGAVSDRKGFETGGEWVDEYGEALVEQSFATP